MFLNIIYNKLLAIKPLASGATFFFFKYSQQNEKYEKQLSIYYHIGTLLHSLAANISILLLEIRELENRETNYENDLH